jgi:hypothetical protein
VKSPVAARFALALLVALSQVGCGDDCEGLCEEKKTCRNADKSVDCTEYCERLEELHEEADCEDQYASLRRCEGRQEDVCEMEADACRSESKRYSDCMSAFCVEEPEKCE